MNSRRIIAEANKKGGAYHMLRFPTGSLLKGIYDMSKYIHNYSIPDDMSGMTVLDVGCATGYFSFEFAKRNAAKVVGLDINITDLQPACNKLMKTNVEFIEADFNDRNFKIPKFDVVFCSNMLQHVSNIFGVIRRIRLLTSVRAIICTDIMCNPAFEKIPVAFFYGTTQKELGRTVESLWQPNIDCLKKMLLFAKFRRVEEVSTFILESEDATKRVKNVVIHAYV